MDASNAGPRARASSQAGDAEGAGFEPAVRVNGLRFSRPVHSTALPPLRNGSTVCAMPETAAPLLAIHRPADRAALVRRARLLAWSGLGWHAIEATVAIAAGIVASSVALIGFGADSVVEAVAGVVVLWRFAAVRVASAE